MSSEWDDFAATIEAKGLLTRVNDLLKSDKQLLAFSSTPTLEAPLQFHIASVPSAQEPLRVEISSNGGIVSIGKGEDSSSSFGLTAQAGQWQEFFKSTPVPPFHSYWGIRAVNAMAGVESVQGSLDDFARFAHVWRRTLELLHDAVCGPTQLHSEPDVAVSDVDIVGRYVNLDVPDWGRCRVFYEKSGTGDTPLVFVHTAGSDARQMHALLADAALSKLCTIYAFDIPGHGRSLLGSDSLLGGYKASEDAFVGTIAGFIKQLGLEKPIICGASMAGDICLAAAIRNSEVHAGAVVPLQACEYAPAPRVAWYRDPSVNAALFCPESVLATMSPTTPTRNKELMWQTYSGQGYGVLSSDLEWFFGGWDGRGRVETIDTKACPVYMLTGDHDWIITPAVSEATAAKIPGASFKAMPGLGHFPISEKPSVFVPFLIHAIEHYRLGPRVG